mmetsp:Transcript_24831/g.53570  ORF Transcript_24831/g.53570 Transcript_24831/m.53570 type:complete len:217 (-) Transcript_24831:1025-1675(-)
MVELLATSEWLASSLCLGVFIAMPLNFGIGFHLDVFRLLLIIRRSVVDCKDQGCLGQPQQRRLGMPKHVIQKELLFLGRNVANLDMLLLSLHIPLLIFLPIHNHFISMNRSQWRRRDNFSSFQCTFGKQPPLPTIPSTSHIGSVIRQSFLCLIIKTNGIPTSFFRLKIHRGIIFRVKFITIIGTFDNQFFSRLDIPMCYKHGMGEVGKTACLERWW